MNKKCRRFIPVLPLLLLAVSVSAVTWPLAAAAKPTLTITNLKNGQKLSNDVFTVLGQATATAGVSNVLCSLNHGAWSAPDTTNNWTNWSAQVNLIAGTNTFSAYALDNNGKPSATNTVKFVYVVFDVMTVRTNGSGTIKPAYNGVLLQDGVNYSMTGKASQLGYGVTAWLDGNSNIVSRSATMTFMMKSNLSLTANFAEKTAPTVKVTGSTTNANGIAYDYVIYGTASDNAGVSGVFYQLNNLPWAFASTTNNWKNWTANISLQPGNNVFSYFAEDTNYNVSTVQKVQIAYNSAPASLSGSSATVTISSTNSIAPFNIAFGSSTFSQFAADTNSVNGVGSYTFVGSGGGGTLKLKYTGPPSATKAGSQTIALAFYSHTLAYFTNKTTAAAGYLQFSPDAKLALANISGQSIWSIGSQGDGYGVLFNKGKYTSSSLGSAATAAGNYAYTQYSRVGSLIKLSGTNGTSYVLTDFADTNNGSYYEEDYDSSGHTNGTDTGRFLVGSQQPGGNAPLSVTNRLFQIFSVGENFNDQFGADTYSQDTLSTNYDNDVGSYTYDRPGTNIGQLNLTVTAPPADAASNTLAGTASAARLIFVNGDGGIFTNGDGTISSFVMTAATNFAPATIVSNTLSLGLFYSMQFAGDGSFVYHDFIFAYPGTYTYAPFSPGGGMIQLSYLDASNNITGRDWMQLNFKATNSGTVFWNQFDSSTNFLDNYTGPFSLY